MNETKTVYMIYVFNRFGVMGIFFADGYKEMNRITSEETAKGRRVKVAEREVSTAAVK
jgi:hypothetical protein